MTNARIRYITPIRLWSTLVNHSRHFDNAINLNGGIEAWACEIDRSMRRYR